MISKDKITEIFFHVDEFCKELNLTMKSQKTITETTGIKHRERSFIMSDSEVITILILFHAMGYRTLKHFYIDYVKKHMTQHFPNTVSYNRFVELQKKCLFPMGVMMKIGLLKECSGISFIDSTCIKVCNNKRIKRNKVFKNIATVGKSTMGWFYGFKLHLVVNDKGEILNFKITTAATDDRQPLKEDLFTEHLFGKLFADKGYISSPLFKSLFDKGIKLITSIKGNMKNKLLEMNEKIMLRKRSIIETINDQLKNISQIEHTRHRSFDNFMTNILGGLMAYSFSDKKPAISIDTKLLNIWNNE